MIPLNVLGCGAVHFLREVIVVLQEAHGIALS